MDLETVKKYRGKRVVIILKNNFRYTCIIPIFTGTSFTISDKFGKTVDVDCDYIATIIEQGEEK